MPSLINAAALGLQFRPNMGIEPKVAARLNPLFPRFQTWNLPGTDARYMGVTCDHPKYPDAREIRVSYRIGYRHEWLMAQRGQEWALRRVELLIRLLLKRLAREVAKAE